MELFKIENLSFSYANQKNMAIRDIDLSIEKGSFNVICGTTGCGKTTLLKMLKKEIRPYGVLNGKVCYKGIPLDKIEKSTSTREIGFVFQNPDNQIVSDKVWNELAFGLENLGLPTPIIRRRVAEMASFFDIEYLFKRDTSTLSGGEKQILNLASIMVLEPEVLLLDEPTSQLDPISTTNFIQSLKKINEDLGTTIIIVEHRLEEILSLADRVILMDDSTIISNDTVLGTCQKMSEIRLKSTSLFNFPASVQIYSAIKSTDKCPINVKEGKIFLENNCKNKIKEISKEEEIILAETIISLKDISFRYGKNHQDILNDLNLEVKKGEVLAIVGGNGTGKTTLLNLLAANIKPYQGKIRINGKNIDSYKKNELYINNLVLLPQNPDDLFVYETVLEELEEVVKIYGITKEESQKRIDDVSKELEITNLYKNHPFDLSGGEKQKIALAKILLLNPQIVLLDEPTKGLDGYLKIKLAKIIKKLKEKAITIILVTHDIEFSALVSDECALLFDGNIICKSSRNDFFNKNSFYTTAANRITRDMYNGIITIDDAIEIIKANEQL